LDGQEDPIIFGHVQVHTDCGRVRIAVEIPEVQTRLVNAPILVRICLLFYAVPSLLKSNASTILNEITNTI